MNLNDLVGKKIKSVKGNSSEMGFFFEDGTSKGIYADGDCCSRSWFEHMDNPEAFKDAVIAEVEEIEMGHVGEQESKEKGYDSCQMYGFKFTTNKGSCTLEMRNDSNGYYGGSIMETEANPELPEITEGF